MRKKEDKSTKDIERVPRSEQPEQDDDVGTGCWHYKLYVRNDETNGQLVEGLANLNWPEFLNREIPPGATEDDLAHTLVNGEYYVIGKRLVKYLYTIPVTHVIVCDFARLTPKPEEHYEKWRRSHSMVSAVNLDSEEYRKEKEEKAKEVKEKQRDIKEVKTDLFI